MRIAITGSRTTVSATVSIPPTPNSSSTCTITGRAAAIGCSAGPGSAACRSRPFALDGFDRGPGHIHERRVVIHSRRGGLCQTQHGHIAGLA